MAIKQNVIDDYNLLSGQQKAAILMLSLDEERSASLFALMDDDEIKELSVIMASLGKINSSVIEQLILEFNDKISSTGSLVGTYESTERLLAKALDKDRVSVIMEEIRGPAGRTMWDKLGNVNEHVLANYLKNEYPQTIAVILSKIKAEHAAKVIALFPENFAMEIVMRMLRMDSVQKEVLDSLEKTLRKEFMSNLSKSTRRDAHELIADIFNSLDRNTENRFMDALEERNRESAERVKSLMFTFEDLTRIDSQGIQVLLRNIDKDKLAIALKGASDTVKDLFFNNMSTRAGKIVKEDMDAMGPVRMRDVEEAQQYIVATAKDLSNSGEIVVSEGNGSDELVY
ncbi:MAG: flagellar motor switch protein FliG [Alphaproteobacteria bacterium]|nr:flagellar motor switch protein FliG [Alphaproteobacteria bacterium]